MFQRPYNLISILGCGTSNLDKESLEKLKDLTIELKTFLKKLEEFYHAEETFIQFENNPQFREILDCTYRLQAIFDKLEDSQIPEIFKNSIKHTKNHYLASILGLEKDAAEFLSGCDNYYSDEQWIIEYIQTKGKIKK